MRRGYALLRRESRGADLVLELRDARAPADSGNFMLDAGHLPGRRLLLLNKSGAASVSTSEAWSRWYRARGEAHVFLDLRLGQGWKALQRQIRRMLGEAQARERRRGLRPDGGRLVILGMPNVGKSTLVNLLCGKRRAIVAPLPGETRGLQWLRSQEGWQVADSTGVMQPRLDPPQAAQHLGWLGLIPPQILGTLPLAEGLLHWLLARGHAETLARHYGLASVPATAEPQAWLELLARRRGLLRAGGCLRTEDMAVRLLRDFQQGLILRISLQEPPLPEVAGGRKSAEPASTTAVKRSHTEE